MEWRANPRCTRRNEEIEAVYLFRVVRDVRNNLFHGGKFGDVPPEELERDRCLIDSATIVLESALAMDDEIREAFEQPASRWFGYNA